jgi:exopolyphosphatase/guanosine-5'-triphosphate,3'-diphosphate pyrophosphatase
MSAARRSHRPRSPGSSNPLVGVIDIGTNSVKLSVGRAVGSRVEVVHFVRKTTRLGEGLGRSGRISARAAERTARVVRSLAARARSLGANRVVAVGTFALRRAKNGRRIARRIGGRSGVAVRVLTGSEEASLAYVSAQARTGRRRPVTLLVDVGGGSTELVVARRGVVRSVRSLPIGALSLAEKFLRRDPIAPGDYRAMRREIESVVSRALARASRASGSADLVVSGGSATTAADMIRAGAIRGARGEARVTLARLRRLEALCLATTLEQRKRLPGLPPDRADIIPAGIAIVIAFATHSRRRSLRVSDGGLREGVILALSRNPTRPSLRSGATGRSPAAARRARRSPRAPDGESGAAPRGERSTGPAAARSRGT